MNRVDIRRFEFDFDNTWAAFFTDSQLRVYSRYGGRDEHEPEARLSKPSLLQTMREVVEIHQAAKLAATRNEGPSAVKPPHEFWQPEPTSSATPMDLPLLRKHHQGCIHCHQVREYDLLQTFHDGKFQREMLFPFPLPESLGLELNRDHGHRIAKVRETSPANVAALIPGEIITGCDDVPIHSEQDLRWALHRIAPSINRVTLTVATGSPSGSRNEDINSLKTRTVELTLPANWRQSDIRWRKSTRSIPVDWGFRAAAMSKTERREAAISEEGMAIWVLSVKPQGFAAAVKLLKGDVILSVDGESQHRSLDQLRSDLLRQHVPGDEIQLSVRRGTETIKLSGRFPDWHTTETSVP